MKCDNTKDSIQNKKQGLFKTEFCTWLSVILGDEAERLPELDIKLS